MSRLLTLILACRFGVKFSGEFNYTLSSCCLFFIPQRSTRPNVIDRNEFSNPGKPLQKERFAAAIDSVGSHTLANICASLKYGGVVTACGLAQGMDLPASVAPFILRGVLLMGIDSVMRPKADRVEAWDRLASLVNADYLDKISTEINLDQVIESAEQLMQGQIRGRVVVNCQS